LSVGLTQPVFYLMLFALLAVTDRIRLRMPTAVAAA
jgi:hypothetical protein